MDGQVFLAQGRGDGEDVLALGAIVFVDAVVGGGGGGHGGHEGLGDLHLLQGVGQGLDGEGDGLAVLIADRSDAGLGRRAPRRPGKFLGQELGEAHAVRAQPFDLAQPVGPDLEARDPPDDVVGPAFLAELAVVDDVEADSRLLLDHLRDRRLHHPRIFGRILGRALLVAAQVGQGLGPRQAADMGGQDPALAALHLMGFLPDSGVGRPALSGGFRGRPCRSRHGEQSKSYCWYFPYWWSGSC